MRDQSVLVYDGNCGFCRAVVHFARMKIKADLRATAFQVADLESLGVTRQRAAREVLWVAPDGQVSGGAQAVAKLLVAAGQPWAGIGIAMQVPVLRVGASCAYRFVARNRRYLSVGAKFFQNKLVGRQINSPEQIP
jgi:predicted DCC family thiol-disulfide oxidoreductase YuxK